MSSHLCHHHAHHRIPQHTETVCSFFPSVVGRQNGACTVGMCRDRMTCSPTTHYRRDRNAQLRFICVYILLGFPYFSFLLLVNHLVAFVVLVLDVVDTHARRGTHKHRHRHTAPRVNKTENQRQQERREIEETHSDASCKDGGKAGKRTQEEPCFSIHHRLASFCFAIRWAHTLCATDKTGGQNRRRGCSGERGVRPTTKCPLGTMNEHPICLALHRHHSAQKQPSPAAAAPTRRDSTTAQLFLRPTEAAVKSVRAR